MGRFDPSLRSLLSVLSYFLRCLLLVNPSQPPPLRLFISNDAGTSDVWDVLTKLTSPSFEISTATSNVGGEKKFRARARAHTHGLTNPL